MATKIEAAKLATASGVTVVIANGSETDVIVRLAAGEAIGTCFRPTTSKLESRKRWLLSQISRGNLLIDSGAVAALQRQNKSLLPAGVTQVGGAFGRGDVVSVSDGGTGTEIARGISNYGSDDVAAIKGAHSEKIEERLGYEYGAEVVHRDNLVVFQTSEDSER
jgi:glutamate 5-kinase